MNTSFDWSLVPSFVAVLEKGSLLGAARQLGVSQPTLGRHIAQLEAQLGAPLFERTGRGLVPNATALRLADDARAMEASAHRLTRQVSGSQGIQGTVRLSATQTFACCLLPPLLLKLRLAQPGVQIELVVDNRVSNLLRREADIALRMVAPRQSELVARRIAQVPVSAYASRDYLARRGRPVQPMDLLGHELIGYDRDTNVLKGFARLGFPVTAEHFAFRSDDLIAQWQAVRAGLGVGFLLDWMAALDSNLVPVLPMLPIPALPLWLVTHREIRGSARIRVVYDFLAVELKAALQGTGASSVK